MIDDYNKDHLPVPSCSTRVIRTGRNKRPYTQLQRRLSKVLFVSIIIILILFISTFIMTLCGITVPNINYLLEALRVIGGLWVQTGL